MSSLKQTVWESGADSSSDHTLMPLVSRTASRRCFPTARWVGCAVAWAVLTAAMMTVPRLSGQGNDAAGGSGPDRSAVGPKVFIIGDSTVKNSGPRAGWGQRMHRYLDERVTVVNEANPGESSRTFITENRWARTLAQVSSNDIVLIQFGHNDSHNPARPESTAADGEYRVNLQRYIDETKARGGIPVLVTPPYRRHFDTNGVLLTYIVDRTGHTNDLAPYVAAMKQVAESNRVACVDLFAASGRHLQKLGPGESASLFAPEDTTHFNETGADAMAALVAEGLARALPAAARWISQSREGPVE